jgi:uncharacterized protein (DUF2252 family)
MSTKHPRTSSTPTGGPRHPKPAEPLTPAPSSGRTVEERLKLGAAARALTPPSAFAAWRPAADRPDPVALLDGQAKTRIAGLVPVRYGRMMASPFAFYRGAALPMAADLTTAPTSGIQTQLCGDAHLSNFGMFASPERDLVFDVTDFDETLPGPWEWDVARLTTSLVVAARMRGFGAHEARHAVHAAVGSYAKRMLEYANMRAIDVYYSQVDATEILASVDTRARAYLKTTIKSAAHHDALHDLKITEMDGGRLRIADHPPMITHPPEVADAFVRAGLSRYRDSLQEDRRALLDRYEFVDAALKVVGVGSVGLGAYLALFEGRGGDDPLFLQVKEAEASVLERFLGPSQTATHGERVVDGQRRLQATSDILLGWTIGDGGRHVYVRQHQDQKSVAVVEAMTVDDLAAWGVLCAWTLARGHARAGDPAVIAGYLGPDDDVGRALGEFAFVYADQNDRDFKTFLAAIKAGRIKAEPGV